VTFQFSTFGFQLSPAAIHHGRGELPGASSLARHQPRKGFRKEGTVVVFVLDKRKHPLMPCTEKRARLLLQRGRAVVHRRVPFTIRLRDRVVAESTLQPIVLKLDPGSKTTGVALAREEATDDSPIHHALHLAEITHKGALVAERMARRAQARRRRRTANLRYRPPRFQNRRRPKGWLTPSMCSRIGNLLTWARRYGCWAPIARIDLEHVRFDTQLLQHPEISDVAYQRGDLYDYELWHYLLAKWGRACVYCGATDRPLERDHIIPQSRHGSDRASNLTVACRPCNQEKGNRTATEYGFPDVQAHAKVPLADAAAVTIMRWALRDRLQALGWPVALWSGGRTHWNRQRFELPNTHAVDALCVGDVAGVTGGGLPVVSMRAMGRGSHCRTRFTGQGFPRGYLLRQKRVHGFQTGDLLRAEVPAGKYAGVHVGRVAVRATGKFRVGTTDPVNWRYCQLLQRADGYEYTWQRDVLAFPPQT
jgi:5-methylcytosine-specific restriction endonuclease McrA